MDHPDPVCPVTMHGDGRPCGRPAYRKAGENAAGNICFMHFRDPKKDAHAFLTEINRILLGVSAYNRPADAFDFSAFLFPGEFTASALKLRTKTLFDKRAIFFGATFEGDVDLNDLTFARGTNFSTCTFRRQLALLRCLFFEETDFFGSIFEGNAVFALSKFFCRPDFRSARFASVTNFQGSEFYLGANFSDAQFAERVSFSQATVGTPISPDLSMPKSLKGEPTADFTSTVFLKPEEAVFLQFNQACKDGLRARFLNSNVGRVRFDDVKWRRARGRLVLEDESDIISPFPDRNTSHEMVANTYRTLIGNFEAKRHYDLAEECFCGVMEMRRRDPANFIFPRLLSEIYSKSVTARWLGSHISIAYLYRVLSKYGSSYARGALCLALMILLFAAIYPFVGLRMIEISHDAISPTASRTVNHQPEFGWSADQNLQQYVRTYGAGLWASVDSATFRKDETVEPATKWGKRIALLEMIVVPGQLALFLLALRRRFRR